MSITASLLILAISGRVAAQCSGRLSISNSSRTAEIAGCEIFDGDISLGSGLNGTVSLDGIVNITGDLRFSYGSDVSILRAPNLVTIGDTFSISYNDLLTTLDFPSLRNIGTVYINNAPNLTEFVSTDGVSNISTIEVIGTGFTNLGWLQSVNLSRLEVTRNPRLNNISLPLVNVWNSIRIAQNGPALRLSLPTLEAVNNVTISHVSEIELPSLEWVTYSLGFIMNYFEALSIEKLYNVDDLMLWNNTALSLLELPGLVNATGDIVTNGNAALETLSLPNLARVEGDLGLNGSFTNISLPALVDVQGNAIVRSSAALDCSTLDPYDVSDVFKAQYNCTGTDLEVELPPEPSTEPSGGGLSKGAIAGIAVGAVVGVLALGLLGWFLWRRRERGMMVGRNDPGDSVIINNDDEKRFTEGHYEADSKAFGRAELPGSHPPELESAVPGRVEMLSEHPELPGDEGAPYLRR